MSTIAHFYYSDAILEYNFGPSHPLKPERLRRTIELLGRYGVEPVDPGPCRTEHIRRVHDEDYVLAVECLDPTTSADRNGSPASYGFGKGDNPAFPGMWEASLAYVSATVRAAEAVRDGAHLSFAIGGGLHHAMPRRASGFCIFNDPAIACHILRERFDRVAYVDIDVHHGDGVQWIFFDDPSVLTCSIHEEGRTLFPGTGFLEETGRSFSSLNVPLMARTTGDVWLDAFERGVLPALNAFKPGAIVLQLGTDTHGLDPLGHIDSDAQSWLGAVNQIRSLGLPIVAVGGGGYNLSTVPRMWGAAVLELAGIDVPDELPSDLAMEWGIPAFLDPEPERTGIGRDFAEGVVGWLESSFHPNIPRV